MSGTLQLILAVWTGCGLLWWLIALGLVAAARKSHLAPAPDTPPPVGISIFKPLPNPRTERERERILGTLATFVVQLDPASELLLGIEPDALPAWTAALIPLRQQGSDRVRVIPLPSLKNYPNRKIAKMEALSHAARHQFWLWSDADVAVPPYFLAAARHDLFRPSPASMTTYPYRVCQAEGCPEWLDAFFVNTEFLPGVLLLRRLGSVPFAFGAAMLFSSDHFRKSVAWEQLGAQLADDYHLGHQLGPCHIGMPLAETLPDAADWPGALTHLHRWRTTTRWCRPGGFAAQILVMPVAGWLAAITLHPDDIMAWCGLWFTVQMDACAALLGVLLGGCTFRPSGLVVAQAWSLLRFLSWLAAWLPIPLRWRGHLWHRPVQSP